VNLRPKAKIKILVIQTKEYDYLTANLIEGLHELSKKYFWLDFKCVEDSNYASFYTDHVVPSSDIDLYANQSDFIIATSNRFVRYDLVQKYSSLGKKIIFLDGADEGHLIYSPQNFYMYLKRECYLEYTQQYKNVKPFPFAAENRYFLQSNDYNKDFDKLWAGKSNGLCCLMKADENRKHRFEIKNAIQEKYGDTDYYIGGHVQDSAKNPTYSFIGQFHNEAYYKTLLNTKIFVDAWGAGKWTSRFFEGLANGCLVFQQSLQDFTYCSEFLDGKDVIFYYNIGELLEKIDYYLNNDEEAKQIAHNGYQKLIQHHKSVHRAEYLVELLRKVF